MVPDLTAGSSPLMFVTFNSSYFYLFSYKTLLLTLENLQIFREVAGVTVSHIAIIVQLDS